MTAAGLVLLLAVQACGSSDSSPPESSGGVSTQAAVEQEPVVGTASGPADGSAPVTQSEPEPEGPDLYLPVAGLIEVPLVTPQHGVGERPLFEWEALEGADYYSLVLFDPHGVPYWAWEGTVTEIYLGGGDQPPPEDSPGPLLQAGMTWAVLAHSAEDAVIGSSIVRPVSP